jgi:hypothetical protein
VGTIFHSVKTLILCVRFKFLLPLFNSLFLLLTHSSLLLNSKSGLLFRASSCVRNEITYSQITGVYLSQTLLTLDSFAGNSSSRLFYCGVLSQNANNVQADVHRSAFCNNETLVTKFPGIFSLPWEMLVMLQ